MKRLIALTMCVVSLGAAAQLPDYVPTDGLVGWWPLDGNAQDASVNEIDLIEVGDVHFESDRFGNTESAIAFNGIDGESRVEFPNFGLIDGLSQGTLSFWVNVMQHDVTGHYFGFDNMFSVRQRHGVNTQFMIALLGGTTRVRVHLDGGLPNSGDLVSQQSLNIGQWHLVTVTFNGVEEMQHIYIDGELDSSMPSGASITSLASPDMLAFGFYGGVGSGSSSSLMDEVGLWDRALNAIEIQSLFLTAAPIEGCTEESACNFDSGAAIDDGSCHFLCQYCREGTVWDEVVQGCIVANPSDSNFDGCVQLNDLLDLLSAYGDCGVEESPWQCGDPLEYQGYDYETVQIGEQCWFAENLRAENYRNGEAIPTDLSDSEWAGTAEGAVSVYDGNMVKLSTYGRLYNWYAVDDTRALCPSSWHVSTDDDWGALELEMTNQGYAGIEGRVLKATEGWADSGNGPDTFGFSARPAGARNFQDGTFYNEGIGGDWWTSSTYHRFLLFNFDTLGQGLTNLNFGFSVRCTKD
tara:strand:- start:222 stop:1787 length:1566 start_codon:yes stop_codon:yes gene_type:complete